MTAVAEPLTNETINARREERLVRLLERASASSRFSFGERWLFGLGGALALAGFVIILIGWAGASHTVLVAGQIPYLLSGGLIGLGLVFLGSFLYFGHWLAVLVRESRERGAEDRDDLALVRQGLQEVSRSLALLASSLGATDPSPRLDAGNGAAANGAAANGAAGNGAAGVVLEGHAPMPPPGDATGPVLLATVAGSMAHRPGCRAIVGKPNVRPVDLSEGFKLCGMCRPLDHAGMQ
jgi:hypothetical protein